MEKRRVQLGSSGDTGCLVDEQRIDVKWCGAIEGLFLFGGMMATVECEPQRSQDGSC